MQSENQTNYSAISELFSIEDSMPRYNSFIGKLFFNNLGGQNKIVEFGAGTGTLSTIYKQLTGVTPVCVEVDRNLQEVLTERGFQVFDDLEKIEGKVGGVFSSNVLEHIQDDEAALLDICKVMDEGAPLLLYLPAFMCLFSGLDKSVGHFRRYEKSDLILKLEKSGFKVTKVHYSDSIGFFMSLFFRFFGYSSKNGLENKSMMRFYDKVLFPMSRMFDLMGCQFFFGKNIFIKAIKL
jgi:hypothetical protein